MKAINHIRLALGLAAVLTLTALPVQISEASEAGAMRTARAAYAALVAKGYSVRDQYKMGYLPLRQTKIIPTTLYTGNDYVLLVGGCEDARDVDLYLADREGNILARDTDRSDVAIVHGSVPYTGTYYLVVRMYDSTPNGAHWALQFGYK